MEIDKQLLIVIFAAIVAMTGVSGYYFGSTQGPAREVVDPDDRPKYKSDDIRHKYQQADLKKPKKATPKTATAEFTKKKGTANKTESARNESGGDSSDENAGDDTELSDEEPQEEPELD